MGKKAALLATLIALSACTSAPYEPIVDLKASRNPKHAQEDLMECEWLIQRYNKGVIEASMVRKCLDGRGHSVLN